MGFDEGRIVLDSPNGAYYPGQTIHGKLIFDQDKEKNFRGIFVKFKGFCKVHWTTQRSHTDSRGKRHTQTIHHESYEEYANVKTYLVGGESGDHKIDPGHYEYPFTFVLPQNCPSSFEGSYGHIRYYIKVVVDRAFKFDQEKKAAIRVHNVVDLNRDPSCRDPIEMEFNATYSCCCMGSGAADTVVNVPVSGFCSGQVMPIEVSCNNKGSVEIDDIKISLVKKIRFIATVNPGERSDKDTVAKITKGPIPENTQRNYTVEMEIPALDVYDVNNCRYIDVSYKLKVVVSPSGCHSDSEGSRRIVIGSIPLVGFQDNIQNPLQDQMPQQVAAVTQQPSYSGNPPYPAGNTPYPGSSSYPGSSPYPSSDPSKSPYPSRNSPYPSNDTKAPYPTENVPLIDNPPPYPGNMITEKPPYPTAHPNSPYLTKASPYPAENPSYPTGNSPAPTTNLPYPPGNLPNPTGNPPYPTGNPPYATGNPPYPTGNPPYPTGNPSIPGVATLKTGNIGFTIPGSTGMNVPMMPLGANVPGVPLDPYASASAPAPDSPDTDKKE